MKRTQLIVVASLIDKQANLGGKHSDEHLRVHDDGRIDAGLCRTGEIFGVKELVLGSIRILEDQQFLNLSMTAHKWLLIKQVSDPSLPFVVVVVIDSIPGSRTRIERVSDRYASARVLDRRRRADDQQRKFISVSVSREDVTSLGVGDHRRLVFD